MTTAYPTLEAFYAANEARRRSPEADYGVWWMDGTLAPKHRVSYVQATGEVYAVQLGGEGQVEVLGVVPPDENPTGKGRFYTTLDQVLEGWPEHCDNEIGGLSWLRRRLREEGYAP